MGALASFLPTQSQWGYSSQPYRVHQPGFMSLGLSAPFSESPASARLGQHYIGNVTSALMNIAGQLDPESPAALQVQARLAALQQQSAQLGLIGGASISPFQSGLFGSPSGISGYSGLTNPTAGLTSGIQTAAESPQVQFMASMATAQALPEKYLGGALGNLHTKLTGQAITGSLGPRMNWLLGAMNGIGQTDAKTAATKESKERMTNIVELHDDLSTKLSTIDPHSTEGQDLIQRLVKLEKTIAAEYDPASDAHIKNLVESLKILLDTIPEGSDPYLAIKQRVTNLQKIRHANGAGSETGSSSSSTGNLLLKNQLSAATRPNNH